MKRRLLMIGVTVIAAICLAGSWILWPHWTERFGYEGDRLVLCSRGTISSPDGTPIPGALVITIAGIHKSGGWGSSIPRRPSGYGNIPCTSFPNTVLSYIASQLSDDVGVVSVPPYSVRCSGRAGLLGSVRSHGVHFLLAYKRGYRVETRSPRINEVGESLFSLPSLAFCYGNSTPDARRFEIPLDVLFPPFSGGSSAEFIREYWTHRLPDGQTIRSFVAQELRANAAPMSDPFFQDVSLDIADELDRLPLSDELILAFHKSIHDRIDKHASPYPPIFGAVRIGCNDPPLAIRRGADSGKP